MCTWGLPVRAKRPTFREQQGRLQKDERKTLRGEEYCSNGLFILPCHMPACMLLAKHTIISAHLESVGTLGRN